MNGSCKSEMHLMLGERQMDKTDSSIRKESLVKQTQNADIKKDAQAIQQELVKELKTLEPSDATAESMNKVFEDVLDAEGKKVQYLRLGDLMMQYVANAEQLQKKTMEIVERAALANAQLVRSNEERNKRVLTPETMAALLRSELPKIKVTNEYPELFALVEKDFSDMKYELNRALLDQTNRYTTKIDRLMLLILAAVLLDIVLLLLMFF